MAKKKQPPKKRNPILADLQTNPLYREKRGASVFDKAAKKDPFDRRKAKHKKIEIDENAVYMDGEQVATYRMERRPGRLHLGEALTVETGRVVINHNGEEHRFSDWHAANDFICASKRLPGALVTSDELAYDGSNLTQQFYDAMMTNDVYGQLMSKIYNTNPKLTPVETVFEDFQCGDKIKVVAGPLKDVLDKAEAKRRKKESEAGKEPAKDDENPKKDQPHDEGVIKEPNGPGTTVGITVNSKYHLVDEEDIQLVFEGLQGIHEDQEQYDDLVEFRFVEVTSGFRVPVSREEQDILDKCEQKMYKSSLDERDEELARRMVSRGVLNRRRDEDGQIFFVRNETKLTRF